MQHLLFGCALCSIQFQRARYSWKILGFFVKFSVRFMRNTMFFTKFSDDRRKKYLERTRPARIMLIRVLHCKGIYMPELSSKIAEAALILLHPL